ncbi:MAG: hypothetical protein F4124_00195 [Acidimicrobiia bacterium]|nr:hypothetical protein [Acidimicrobiia bacterium]MYB75279.1 hypothetical protein [Acidimicrobiia bacterium]MYH97839.1 hypothetical protein [Acidimicrobiia bacterium]
MLREYRNKSGEDRLLGSIDNAGTRLCDVAPSLLELVAHSTTVEGLEENQPEINFKETVPILGYDRHAAILNHYQYGNRGVLNRYTQGDMTPFEEIDSQQTGVAILLSSPPANSVGFIALQVPNGRGVKKGVETGLREIFRDRYDLHFRMEPVVPLDVVVNAIEQHGVGFVSFRKLNNPAGLFTNESEWWTTDSQLAKVEFKLSPSRYGRLVGEKIADFIRGKSKSQTEDNDDSIPMSFEELATIQGDTYDEMSVEVFINGRKKVMRLDLYDHWMSHAFSWEL